MLGLHDPWIAGAYLLCIASTLLCVGYAYWGQHQGE
ncbi:symporter small accessory protein [Heliomicrobium modesticaldum]